MKVARDGFEQCYNAQAAVACERALAMATGLVQVANDKEQVKPMLEQLAALPTILADTNALPGQNRSPSILHPRGKWRTSSGPRRDGSGTPCANRP